MPVTDKGPGSEALALVVMGVSGSGKSTIAAQLAGRLGLPYVDADDLHPAANVAKMRTGTPLTDDDRWPWLDRVAEALHKAATEGKGAVVACSALRLVYRNRLRERTGVPIRFVFLDAPFALIHERLAQRAHHFMPESLLRSQFETLERPTDAETDVVTVSVDQAPAAVVAAIVDHLPVGSNRGI